ncbi:hypothetical protein ACNKHM_04700 [Shigella sonnei]
MVVQQKTGDFLGGIVACWKVLEKQVLPCVTLVCRNSRPAMASANCPHQPLVAADPFLVLAAAELSPLHLMDDVLGRR